MENWRKFAKETKKVIQERFTPIGQGVVPGKNMVYYLGANKYGQLFYGKAEAEDPEEMQLAGKQAMLNAEPIDDLKAIPHKIHPAIARKAKTILSSIKARPAPNTGATQTAKQPAKNNSDFQAPQIKQLGGVTVEKAFDTGKELIKRKQPQQRIKGYFLMTYAMMLNKNFNAEHKLKLTNLLKDNLKGANVPTNSQEEFINTLMSGKIQAASKMMTIMFKQQ
jgi:hypothetical protein